MSNTGLSNNRIIPGETSETATTRELSNAFPDPSEDLFWQKAKSADDDNGQLDAVWNPEKQGSINLVIPKDTNATTPPLPPPPTNANNNNATRHSRKSSRVNWNLQTDSEKHVETLETRLKDLKSNTAKLISPTATDFGGTALATLGYHPEESTTIATALNATSSADAGEEVDINNDDDADYFSGDAEIPQEYDEGLWLLWKNTPVQKPSTPSNEGERRRSFLLPLLSRNNYGGGVMDDYNNSDGGGEGHGSYHDDDEDRDNADEEILLDSARRKLEKEYLWGGAGWWWWSAAAITQRWIGCGMCGLEEDEIIGEWN